MIVTPRPYNMSSITYNEKQTLERLLDMSGGHVADFSRRNLGEFVQDAIAVDIFSEIYSAKGDSKANRLRAIWDKEPDSVVAVLLHKLCDYVECLQSKQDSTSAALNKASRKIAERLSSGDTKHHSLREHAKLLRAGNLEESILRLEKSADSDVSQAIGTAKDIIETTCKTILSDRGVEVPRTPKFDWLTKETLKTLNLIPEGISDERAGAKTIKVMLHNLASVAKCLDELRNFYGTGHGRHGRAIGLQSRHAKLAAHASVAFCNFVLNTHSKRSK